ncbi:MAG TPA: glycosyltransferase family 39 protein [Ferruginibacter sp.]|jgi:4-amino-4-deoxy-L-arabinose transferase-like glycosyltransferase|nr:glycosyltransferase family 39 protein [Ferruginibacter sp.]
MRKSIVFFFLFICLIYFIGFGIDVMDVDAAQYASMSREMLASGHFLQVYDFGKDYLDKPPFLFWISALSMKIFGINNFAYRFPSFLFAVFAIFSTYKLAGLFYKKDIAVLAAVVLASCQALFLINHDVRTDTILMSWVIFSIWQLAAWYQDNKLFHFLLACLGIAGGLLTKGPIALFVPIFAFGSQFILQRNFKMLVKWQYLLGVVLIGLLLIPMCIGLYQQFDLQPQKMVIGKTGVSGLRFFFWTQSFGRITGESEWNNGANIFFLLQNMLWSFLPWILFFLLAFFLECKQLVKQKFKLLEGQEWICMGGFLLTYLALGISKYQLPHYIFVVFPFAAIITAKFIYALLFEEKYSALKKPLFWIHFSIFSLLWIALLFILSYCFSSIPIWVAIIALVLFIVFIFLSFSADKMVPRLLAICLFTIMGVNLFLNYAVYPALLQYQKGSVVGRWIHDNKLPADHFYLYKENDIHSLDFYAQSLIGHKDSTSQLIAGDYLIADKNKLADLDKAEKKYTIEYSGEDFHVTALSFQFLNPATREGEVKRYAVIKIQ